MDENKVLDEMMDTENTTVFDVGTDIVSEPGFMDKYGNIVGSASGAAGVLIVYELGKHVVLPLGKKAWNKGKEIIHNIRFPHPKDVEADYKEVDEDETDDSKKNQKKK